MTLIENVIPQQQAIITMKISSSSTLDSNLSQMSISFILHDEFYLKVFHTAANNGADWEMKWRETVEIRAFDWKII